jgi:hypothetical protein
LPFCGPGSHQPRKTVEISSRWAKPGGGELEPRIKFIIETKTSKSQRERLTDKVWALNNRTVDAEESIESLHGYIPCMSKLRPLSTGYIPCMPKLRPFVTSCIPILADRCPLTLADTLATSLYEKTARIVPQAVVKLSQAATMTSCSTCRRLPVSPE